MFESYVVVVASVRWGFIYRIANAVYGVSKCLGLWIGGERA